MSNRDQPSTLRARLYGAAWFKGPRARAKVAEDLVTDASPETVRILEEAVSRSSDKHVHQIALRGLSLLAQEGCEGPAQEALCRLATEAGNPIAFKIAAANGYTPKEAHQRVLFFFLTGQWDKYENLDAENRLIKSIYESADDRTRKRIVSIARRAGRLDWVSVATGGRQGRRLSEMTEDEWHAVISILEYRKRWEELWLLAQKGPPFFSVRIMHRLRRSGFTPSQGVYQRLASIGDHLDERMPSLASLAWPLLKESTAGEVKLNMGSDGRMIAKWDQESVVCLWSHRKSILNFVKGYPYDSPLRRPWAVSGEGRVLVGGLEGTYAWSLPDGKLLKILERPSSLTALAISPDGKLFAGGGKDGTIGLWSLPDGRLLRTLEGYCRDVHALAIAPDGKLLASAYGNNTICLWSLPGGKLLQTREESGAWFGKLAITPDGKTLASNSHDALNLWGLPDLKLLQTLRTHRSFSDTMNIIISPDGKILASVTASPT